jgi:hypothetical protein
MRNILTIAVACLATAGCARNASKIDAAYVSPLQYNSLTCEQIAEESARVASRAAQVTGQQNKQASNDAVAMGVGLVIFWPALFFVGGKNDKSGEVARLKGEMDALEQASIQKGCGIQFRPS